MFSCACGEVLRVFSWIFRAISRKSAITFSFALLVGICASASAQVKVATTTALSVSTSAGSNATVPSGTVVTLTVSVSSASGAVTKGTVDFCDAAAKYCTDIHALGTAQLTSAGKAIMKFRPGIGSHSYKAVFAGTNASAGSSSSGSAIAVTGKYATTTSITLDGSPGNYILTANVAGVSNTPGTAAPTGSVSFLDTNNGNAVLGTAPVGSGTAGFDFFSSSTSTVKQEANAVAVADFNGDGIPDIAVSDSNSSQTLLAILLGKGDGTFTPVSTSPTVGLYPDSIAVADYNGDGIPDLAVTSVDDNLVTVLLGVGDGTFTSAPQLSTVSTPQSVATGDFNGDGVPRGSQRRFDLALPRSGRWHIYRGTREPCHRNEHDCGNDRRLQQ